jgi:hypothetical protein
MWHEHLLAALGNSLLFCGKLALFLVPLMIAMEFLKGTALFRVRDNAFSRAMARFGFSPHALMPLLAGLMFGIAYGAGVILAMAKEHGLSRRDVTSVALFLSLCHAVVEDPLLFVFVGGHFLWMLVPRLAMALAATWALETWRRRKIASF